MVKAQVKAGGRGKAGGVKLAKTPDEAEQHAEAILGHGDQGPDRQPGADRAGREHRGGVLLLLPARPREPRQYLCIASVEGGVEIEEVAKTNPDAVAADRDRPAAPVSTRPRPARSSPTRSSPRRSTDQAVQTVMALWKVFVEEDATLVEVNPLARLAGDKLEALDGKVSLDENAEFRHEDHAGFEDQGRGRPARGEGQGEGPQLRQARRRGRHHRQRRGAGHVHPRRRRLRRREARRREARQLPRHRRRRVRRR